MLCPIAIMICSVENPYNHSAQLQFVYSVENLQPLCASTSKRIVRVEYKYPIDKARDLTTSWTTLEHPNALALALAHTTLTHLEHTPQPTTATCLKLNQSTDACKQIFALESRIPPEGTLTTYYSLTHVALASPSSDLSTDIGS
mmetsp:Transcript_14608/g.23775  ORF Transcript_14608/g.23775 Transcript_14608/m.23775 type:complete len:144 (+) Transcript_14608:905-1336(+)